MSLNITRWSPDTCSCVIEYEWDPAVSEDKRTHNFHRVVNQCEEHTGITQHVEVHTHVLAENQTKNQVVGKVFKHVPRLKKQRIDESGQTVQELDDTVDYQWQFSGKDKNRQLKVALKNAKLTAKEKTDLTQAITTLDKSVTLE